MGYMVGFIHYMTTYANLSMSACLVTLCAIACPGSKRSGKAYQEKLGKNYDGRQENWSL